MIYAVLNDLNVCVGLSNLSGYVDSPELILIESLDNDLLCRKYENGTWSTEKLKPIDTSNGVTVDDRLTALESALLELMLS